MVFWLERIVLKCNNTCSRLPEKFTLEIPIYIYMHFKFINVTAMRSCNIEHCGPDVINITSVVLIDFHRKFVSSCSSASST